MSVCSCSKVPLYSYSYLNFILISKKRHEWLRTLWHPLCVLIWLIEMWPEMKRVCDHAVTKGDDENRGRRDLATLGNLRWTPQSRGDQRPEWWEIGTLILEVFDLSVLCGDIIKKETKAYVWPKFVLSVCPQFEFNLTGKEIDFSTKKSSLLIYLLNN